MDEPSGASILTTRLTLAEGDVRVAARRVAAFVRIDPEARVCPPCLAIDLHIPFVMILAALPRVLRPAGIRLTFHEACARCGAHTPVVSVTPAPRSA
jgi:hypothetical protein